MPFTKRIETVEVQPTDVTARSRSYHRLDNLDLKIDSKSLLIEIKRDCHVSSLFVSLSSKRLRMFRLSRYYHKRHSIKEVGGPICHLFLIDEKWCFHLAQSSPHGSASEEGKELTCAANDQCGWLSFSVGYIWIRNIGMQLLLHFFGDLTWLIMIIMYIRNTAVIAVYELTNFLCIAKLRADWIDGL